MALIMNPSTTPWSTARHARALLAGPALGSVRFRARGELTLPARVFEGGR